MNHPRRRRANPPAESPERCRCAECEALAEGADLDPEACMQAVAEDIRTAGWSVSAVLGTTARTDLSVVPPLSGDGAA